MIGNHLTLQSLAIKVLGKEAGAMEPLSIPLTDFVKSAPTFSGKSFGKNSSKEIGVDSLIETGKCDLLIQNKDNNLARGIKIMFFFILLKCHTFEEFKNTE